MAEVKEDEPKLRFSKDVLDTLGKLLPVFAILAALTYALGLLVCWITDAKLGVGAISVPKERAIVTGLLVGITLLPIINASLYALGIRLETTLNRSLLLTVSGLVTTWGVAAAISALLMMTGAGGSSQQGLNTLFPRLLLEPGLLGTVVIGSALLDLVRKSEKLTPLYVSVAVAILFHPTMFSAACGDAIASPFGGYYGSKVLIGLSNGEQLMATYLLSDDSVAVVRIDGRVYSLSKSRITFIAAGIDNTHLPALSK